MTDPESFAAAGEIELPAGSVPCELSVGPGGLVAREGDRAFLQLPAHRIGDVTRQDYQIIVTDAFDGGRVVLRRFARRTDELETALRRARAGTLVGLMAPPGKTPMDVFEAVGERPGLLYRYDDGLRWVPHAGDCSARLYSEIGDARFDPQDYALVLTGPFGETRIGGLRRLTRELAAETLVHVGRARPQFADALEAEGLPWRDLAESGQLAAHVPFEATGERIEQVGKSRIICEGRWEYWEIMVNEGAIRRLVLSATEDGIRGVALCAARDGELYETLSETDHASFVFADAGDVVRAWTEAGFRREPIFSPAERDPAAALARVLPSLRRARQGLLARVIHDEPRLWRERLFK